MSPRRRLRQLRDRLFGDPYERALHAAARNPPARLVYFWNRGLGDIALGLVPMFQRARECVPRTAIEVVTRPDLAEAFALTDADIVHVAPSLVRDDARTLAHACAQLASDPRIGALVFDDPDPNRWLAIAPARCTPRLNWNSALDTRAPRVDAEPPCIAVHVSTETAQHYGYTKDWPAQRFRELFAIALRDSAARFVLLGHRADEPFEAPNVVDLRGRTGLIEMIAFVRTRCAALLAPDGGVLNAIYWLDAQFPIRVVSLWSDARQGVMRARAPSPNRDLVHVPLVGAHRDVANVGVDRVVDALAPVLRR